MKDHALLFSALAASLLLVLIAVSALAEDPTRGLLLGALPALLGVLVWILTNQAGYPSRDPDSLPHERPAEPVKTPETPASQAPAPRAPEPRAPAPAAGPADNAMADDEPVWDPFDGQRREPVAPEPATEPIDSGDPFAHIDQPPVEIAKRPE